MCYGHNNQGGRSISPTERGRWRAVEELRGRLAETEARLERARAREAELSRQLEEMKRFVSVMEILESYLNRQFLLQQQQQQQQERNYVVSTPTTTITTTTTAILSLSSLS